MSWECGCERGGDCTKTTVCSVESALEDQAYEYEAKIEELEENVKEQSRRIDDMYDIRTTVTARQRANDFNYWMGNKLTYRAVKELSKHFAVLEKMKWKKELN